MEQIIFENEIAYKTKYDGYYVTKSGKVVTVKVKGGQGKVDYSNPREHNYKTDKDGYLEVCLSCVINGEHKRIYKRVHRLVYETIVSEIPDGLTIDHINSKEKSKNSIDNLQVLSREDNTRKAVKGVKSPKRYMYKLYKDDVYLGLYDRNELRTKIGLKHKDYYSDTSNKKQLLLQGYKWILENVEDIERVS